MDTNDDTNNGTNDGTTASSTSGAPSSREREDLVAALDRHHGFLLQTVQGLDEAQLRTRSSVSEFTLAALLKHVAETEEAWAVFARDGVFPGADEWASWAADSGDDASDGSGDAAAVGAGWGDDDASATTTTGDASDGGWGGDWGVTDADTLPVLTARLAQAAAGTRELVRTLDLDRSFPLPSAPWFEAGASWTVRRVLLHILAEVSQHAGHADIIREGIDGARTMG
ncbi:DUF664 domain-containing protein [Miniimonas arenae]|uniref:DUF664 domain-containing protein n=1 Tax=Miniimonas arenae TaxID=676201 RepID=A0A5C5B9R4_9MICO|nr:DUF664 domain-containing protein [Miniimonas arenae]TNU73254.1 DUF664 domain-containing protein [Miniimonas arenae]